MAEKKITQREMFADVKVVLEQAGRNDLAEFIQTRINILANKSANRKTKTESELDVQTKEHILSALDTAGQTVTQIMGKDKFFAENEISNQKITSILKGLKESGQVDKEKSGKSMLYKLV
jgi:DNA-binding transcriptional ArsR family regulator